VLKESPFLRRTPAAVVAPAETAATEEQPPPDAAVLSPAAGFIFCGGGTGPETVGFDLGKGGSDVADSQGDAVVCGDTEVCGAWRCGALIMGPLWCVVCDDTGMCGAWGVLCGDAEVCGV
jgi:hypothetical protein